MKCLDPGDAAVQLRGAGVVEPADSHQRGLPVHQPEAHAAVRPRHRGEVLHPRPAQVRTHWGGGEFKSW